MAQYLKQANTFKVLPDEAISVSDNLPVGYYGVFQTQSGELYLKVMDDFTVPSKLYGNSIKHTERILRTFEHRNGSTGAMFAGHKGSGKTLLARNISIEGIKKGYPTIMVTSGLKGDTFNDFIQSIEQPAIVMFDEFEKNYSRDEQEVFLSLFDGVFQTKKLFIFTVNEVHRVQEHMKNRPGRIYYMIEFDTLGEDFIKEYIDDNLNNKSRAADIITIAKMFDKFSFDMLQALVDEINYYDSPMMELIELLNVKPMMDRSNYQIKLFNNGTQMELYDYDIMDVSPLTLESLSLNFRDTANETDDDGEDDSYITFIQDMLVSFDKESGAFTYNQKIGNNVYQLVAKPHKKEAFDMASIMN